MAVIAKSDTVVGNKCPIPTELYRGRVIGTKEGKSSGGHPMTTLTCEIIAPETVVIDDKEYKIAGRQFMLWLMHVPSEQWGQGKVFSFMDKLGLDCGEDYDTTKHKEYFLGMEFDIILSSEEDIKRMAPKPGQKLGDPIRDGEGNPISLGYRITTDLDNVPVHCRPTRTELPY